MKQCLVILTLLAWTASAALAQTAPWKQYLGANTGGSFSTEVWRATTRGGYPRGSNVASMNSTIALAKLDEVLALDDWVNLQDGYNYRQQTEVDRIAALYGVPMATLAASPRAYGYFDITDEAPTVRHPLFLVSGLNDTSAPPPVMDDYGLALTAAGKTFETYYPADGPHGFVVSSPLIPETTEFATRAVTFITKYFSLADTDADGLPDGWERSRFNSLSFGSIDDPDGDGQNNLGEYRAGTHPLLASSVMLISSTTLTPAGQVTLRFPLVPGLGHVMDFTPDLTTWHTITAPVFTEPQTGFAEWTDDGTLTGGAAPQRFYRLRLP
jgi:hypothetical protein